MLHSIRAGLSVSGWRERRCVRVVLNGRTSPDHPLCEHEELLTTVCLRTGAKRRAEMCRSSRAGCAGGVRRRAAPPPRNPPSKSSTSRPRAPGLTVPPSSRTGDRPPLWTRTGWNPWAQVVLTIPCLPHRSLLASRLFLSSSTAQLESAFIVTMPLNRVQMKLRTPQTGDSALSISANQISSSQSRQSPVGTSCSAA